MDTNGGSVADVRRFNRFYTRELGILAEGHLQTGFSLTEARVLYELAHRDGPTAAELGVALGIDAGYLSRILRGFGKRGLVSRRASPSDGRRSHLHLTRKGRDAFADLDRRTEAEIEGLLGRLPDDARPRLVGAMRTIEGLLGEPAPVPDETSYTIRGPRPGDLGWVVESHGRLYAREYGWDDRFEALVARIVADFVERRDPARDRCWIAERDGANVGSIFVVAHPERAGVAKLRLLLVEPSARGLGIGRRLVDEVTAFARAAGYHTITLWTNSVLVAARRIYEAAGYRLVAEEPHTSFGAGLVGQTWERAL